MDELIYDIALTYDESITPLEKTTIYSKYGSSKKILELNTSTLKNILGRKWSGKSFNKESLFKKAETAYNYILKSNIKVLRFDDKNYPEGLKMIPDFPFILYCKGELNYSFNESIAIVGTRKPTFIGLKKTGDFTKYFTDKNFTIVSGLALGIDTKAHETALLNKGKTIAVLGCGIDKIYPAANKALAKMLLSQNSAIVSEYPPGVLPKKWNFPKRNRIIVGLSRYVLITESPSRSGSLISAYLSADYNRELFVASPENSQSPSFSGNKELIFTGATEIKKNEDFIFL